MSANEIYGVFLVEQPATAAVVAKANISRAGELNQPCKVEKKAKSEEVINLGRHSELVRAFERKFKSCHFTGLANVGLKEKSWIGV